MIVFDEDKTRLKTIRTLLEKIHSIYEIFYDVDKCLDYLKDLEDIDDLMIGTPSVDLIQWITSMQPPLKNIILYCDFSSAIKSLRKAKYTVSHVTYDVLIERLKGIKNV